MDPPKEEVSNNTTSEESTDSEASNPPDQYFRWNLLASARNLASASQQAAENNLWTNGTDWNPDVVTYVPVLQGEIPSTSRMSNSTEGTQGTEETLDSDVTNVSQIVVEDSGDDLSFLATSSANNPRPDGVYSMYLPSTSTHGVPQESSDPAVQDPSRPATLNPDASKDDSAIELIDVVVGENSGITSNTSPWVIKDLEEEDSSDEAPGSPPPAKRSKFE